MGFITEDKAFVFHCVNCSGLINVRMEKCRFCGVPVDRQAAQEHAERLRLVSHAQTDAGTLRFPAPGFVVLAVPWKHFKAEDAIGFLPFKKLPLKSLAAAILFVLFLVMCRRWQSQYGKHDLNEAEFIDAKRIRAQALRIAIAGLVAVFIIDVVITILILRLENGRS